MARRRRKTSGKTVARGYGYEHRQRRERLLRQLVDGTPCRRCGRPMLKTQPLDLGHPIGRPASAGAVGDALEHRACNRGHRLPGRPSTSRQW